MISTIYKRTFSVLMKKPLKLWGISLLGVLLSGLLTSLCGVAIPGLGLAVSLLLSTSLTMVFLHGYRGEEVKVVHLFDCFKDWNTMKRVVLGLAWMLLWIFLWNLIPIVGPFIAIVRVYQYRLTPYILITEPDVPLTEAIEVSKKRTEGFKMKMFLAELLFGVILFVLLLILGLLAAIPVLGFVFAIAMIVVIALAPLFMGLMQAAFYEEITAANAPKNVCPNCGKALAANSPFCGGCGTKL